MSSCDGKWRVNLDDQTIELLCDPLKEGEVLIMGYMRTREWSFEIVSTKKLKSDEVVLIRSY